MKKKLKIPFINTPLRWVFFLGIITALILWALLVITNFFAPPEEVQQESTQPEIVTESVDLQATYPDAYKFIHNYFDQIQRGNYDTLNTLYWVEDIENEIQAECGSPLADIGEEEPASKAWSHCGYFRSVDVEIIEIKESDIGFSAIVQFTNQQGAIVGIETHPEWVRGHQLSLIKQPEGGLRTSDWQFITL